MRFVVPCLNLLLAAAVISAPTHADAESIETVRASIQKIVPDVNVDQLRPSPVSGMYYATLAGTSGYVTADGKYFIPGDLFELRSRTNLTEQDRKVVRLEVFKQTEKDAIEFAPPNPKHWIAVFTDVDCGYCRKLHGEIAKYNELGIGVRYVAYPRSGPGTESWKKMEAVWCSADRRDALTRAKLGEKIEPKANCSAPSVAAQYAMGQSIGMQGTPMILLPDGRSVPGYAPPADLAQMFDKQSNDKSTARVAH